MRRFATEGRLKWMLVVMAPMLGCGDDDAAGGGSSASATTPTTGPGTTTDVIPTTSGTDSGEPTTTDAMSATDPTPGTTTDVTPPPPLEVACGSLPMGAQGAAYNAQPSASGGVPGYAWSAAGLPAGLEIHPNTGKISGTPETMGQFDVELVITDVKDATAMVTCPLTIAEAFAVDHEALAGEGPCLTAGGKTILDFISGGDGTDITCKVLTGTGNGTLPAGLGVDPATCEVTGTVAETRYGGWAWIVGAEQSGVTVHAPYCATQTQQAPKAYQIIGDHGGQQDNGLTPLVVALKADQPLRFDGDADPYFSVIKGDCGGTCFFGFLYRASSSPFGTGPCKDDKDGCFGLCPLIADANEPDGDTAIQCSLLPVGETPKVGFAHEMWAKGEVLPDAFKTRPFVVQWSMDYCVSDTAADCQGKDAILANGDSSNFEFPVIFRPQ